MNEKKINIEVAPLQGCTDAAYRFFHNKVYGGDYAYYTPFIRLEKGELRHKDESDAFGELNDKIKVVPQIIFKDEEELKRLVELVAGHGAKRIDLNMGCPFPLQTARGRGAATISDEKLGKSVEKIVAQHPDIEFSVKMRLGMKDKGEWERLLPYLNNVSLHHVTLHPRVARQQYGGEVDLEEFNKFLEQSRNSVIYNGDIRNVSDAQEILKRFPDISGIMLGRGLLGRPSLANEIENGAEMPREDRIRLMIQFHNQLLMHYKTTLLGGEHQVLSKIKPFWEFAETEMGRKSWKGVKKAVNMPKYNTALALIDSEGKNL